MKHLGMAPEEGAYSRDKMSDPAYKPPLRFRLALRLQNGGRICGTLRYYVSTLSLHIESTDSMIMFTALSLPCCSPSNLDISYAKAPS